MNILNDPPLLLSDQSGQERAVDLPSLLAAYAVGEVRDLPFLRPHQRASWHSFCVQLGALALYRAGAQTIPDVAEAWRGLLRALTADWPDDEPWRLVVEDVTKPAFMQAPIPNGATDPHKNLIETPDDLDVLVTSKNHGMKQGLAGKAGPAAWVAALVTLQTTGGFLGAGNYGVARMNGGFATRPQIGLVPPGGPGAHWQRDVTVMLRQRDWFFRQVDGFAQDGGQALLWCLPWDGAASLELAELDPWCIEICRHVRLGRGTDGALLARSGGSSAARIAAKERKGNLADPWTPIDLHKESAAYNTAPRYAVMSAVLFDDSHWIRPLLLDWQEGSDPDVMTARFDVVVRGQGTTEGHLVREVRIAGERRLRLMQSPAGRDRLAKLNRDMLEDVKMLRNKVLSIALMTLVQAGEDVDFGDTTAKTWVRPWLDEVDRLIEPIFFDHLFARAENEAGAGLAWANVLGRIAHVVFDAAVDALPINGARRLKATAVAERRLNSIFRTCFKGYLPQQEAAHVS